jgi:hypothetical protein
LPEALKGCVAVQKQPGVADAMIEAEHVTAGQVARCHSPEALLAFLRRLLLAVREPPGAS